MSYPPLLTLNVIWSLNVPCVTPGVFCGYISFKGTSQYCQGFYGLGSLEWISAYRVVLKSDLNSFFYLQVQQSADWINKGRGALADLWAWAGLSSPKLPALILQFLHRAAPGDFWRRDSEAGDRNFPSGCVWWPELELLLPLSQCYRWFSCSKVESLPDFCLCPGHWAAFPMSQLRWVLSVIPSSWLELLPHSMWLLHFSELQKGHSEQSALKPCF